MISGSEVKVVVKSKYLQRLSQQNYAWLLNYIFTKTQKINNFSNLHLKTFSNLYTFLAVDSVRHVTSQKDRSDSHFLPLDVASAFVEVCCF